MRTLWLTRRDQPLNGYETKMLMSFWGEHGWHCTRHFSHRKFGRKFYHIKATK